jgi:hypothetical protein
MKVINAFVMLFLLLTSAFANDPASIPWPVGSTPPIMNSTKTLMNSYGDPQNAWGDGFHCGVDFDVWTEPPLGTTLVRCVHGETGSPVVISRRLQDYWRGYYEWTVITTPGTDEYNHEDYGWCYEHLTNPVDLVTPENSDDGVPGWQLWEEINVGEQIASMNPDVETQHTHFKWTTWDFDDWCYVNPLDYLTPSASGSNYTWTFNPSGYTPAFELFFGEQRIPEAWPASPTLVVEDPNFLKDENNLSGAVDVFIGYGLSGVGQTTMPECGRNDLAAERIFWKIRMNTVSGYQDIVNKWLVNFDCPLTYQDTENCKLLYFKWDLDQLNNIFTYIPDELDHEGLIVCLTNCGDAEGWDNLGIDNIEENWWQTNAVLDGTEVTINPTLAAFPDGAYQLEATLYSHDSNVSETYDVSCELHNFAPALREVFILNSATQEEYYHGEWVPNGPSAELAVSDTPAPAGAELQVILVFTEEMNTSSTLTAILGPLAVTSGTWSSSVVPNDTWTGEVTLPASLTDGSYILSVDGVEDVDGNLLMDPEGAGTVPGPSRDTHHSLDLGFETELEWSVSVHDEVLGSPKLADMNGDGVLDIIIQSADGWVDVLDDDGSSMWGGAVDGGWQSLPWDPPSVTASPAIADLSADLLPEVIAVNPNGCNGFKATGEVILNWEGIVIADDPDPEIAYALRWYSESSPVCFDAVENSYHEYVNGRNRVIDGTGIAIFSARHTDGSPLWGSAIGSSGSIESVSATPCIADVDNDGYLEVVVATSNKQTATNGGTDENGWVYCYDAASGDQEWAYNANVQHVYSNVVAGDLDGDGNLEIVIGLLDISGGVRVIDGDSGTLESWGNLSTGSMIFSGASIADIDSDGNNDIAISCVDNKVYCWEGGTGNSLTGFPLNLGTRTNSGISIGDVDSDGMLELVLAGRNGKLYVINHDGTIASGFPVTVSETNLLSGQPALGDIDDDGRLEIIFGEQNNSVVHCYELGANSANNYLPWPQFQHDAQNTGYFPTDITPPAPPTDFDGEGEMNGFILTVDLAWTVSVNDPTSATPQLPTDVVSYNIYRKIPPRPIELIATLPAGTSDYTDVITFTSFPYPSAVAYYASAWDGVNESVYTTKIKILTGSLFNIASGCPVREVSHSAGVRTSQGLTSAGIGTGSSLSGSRQRNNCRVLTDGAYDEVYFPSGSSDCVEIDLGDVFTITDAVVFSGNLSLSESVVDYYPVLMSGTQIDDCIAYELSVDGRTFSRTDSGRARYVRVYGVSGATEIEVYGETSSATSAPVEILRSASEGYRITAGAGSFLTVTVFDLTGRTVWNSTSFSGEILWNRCSSSGNSVPNGVYLIMVESEDMETYTAKVIVR